jgi:hypothetical protein
LFREIALSEHFARLEEAGGTKLAGTGMTGRGEGERR